MTVLVHLNHGINKTYLVDLGDDMTRETLQNMMACGAERAAERIFLRSKDRIEVPAEETQKAAMAADFIVSQAGYTSERLA